MAPRLILAEEIERKVRTARPLLGGQIPSDLEARLGATHYDGKYYRSQRPFLLEAVKFLGLGMHVVKLGLAINCRVTTKTRTGGLSPRHRGVVEVAKHPYFVKAFSLPFSTFVLEIAPLGRDGKGFADPSRDSTEDEQQFYELAGYLFRTYRERAVTFILQHWEGDWMLRGATTNRHGSGGRCPTPKIAARVLSTG